MNVKQLYHEKYILTEAEKSWLDHRVWHTTSSGKKNLVKIKSLDPQERKRYEYIKHRYKHDRDELGDNITGDGSEAIDMVPYLSLYVAFKNSDGIDGLKRSDLSIGTNNPLIAIDLDEEYGISQVHNIPMQAVMKYCIIDEDGDDGEWLSAPIEFDEEELKEFYSYGKDKKFILNMYDYKDNLYVGEDK